MTLRLAPFVVPPYPQLSPNGTTTLAGSAKPAWPAIDPVAFHGLAGEVVQLLDPHTEADPVGVLLTLLAGVGAVIGPDPHAFAELDHPARLNVALVGDTAKGRKGSSWANVRRVLAVADPEFVTARVQGGFGSGEALADELIGTDKRLLIVEPEFARVLNVAARDGSILSAVIRGLWDSGRIEVRSRAAGRVIAEGAHVSVVGHITADELRQKLTAIEIASGFANRFLFALVRRSKRLPAGGHLDDEEVAWVGHKLKERVDGARSVGQLRRSHEAEQRWTGLYDIMADDAPPGLLGSVIARDAPQVLRLSLVFALLDASTVIQLDHLDAAWGAWRYCRDSAELLFGRATGDVVADRLSALLRVAPDGMLQRQAIGRAFAHTSSQLVDRAIDLLEGRGLVRRMTVSGNGRPATHIMLVEGS